MENKIFNERRWWYSVGLILMFVVCVTCVVWAVAASQPGSVKGGYFILFLCGLLVGSCALLVILYTGNFRSFRTDLNNALALIETKTGHIVRAQLREVRLKPWPFLTEYSVKQYPLSFGFNTRLNPITSNPKVIPLSLFLEVMIADHEVLPDWFVAFVAAPEVARQRFFAETFELLQHRLPREISDSLNPFDGSTIEGLKDYLSQELATVLPFQHNIDDLKVRMVT